MAKARSPDFKSPICRLSFAQGLYKPRAQTDKDGKPIGAAKYGCTLIFPLSDRVILEKYVAEVITAEWGEKGLTMAKNKLIKSPFLAGDGKEARNKATGELHPGMGAEFFFIRPSANADRKPPFVIWKSPNVQETDETVYSGCYGKAVLSAFAWHNAQSGDGVSFGIQGFQKFRDGERLGGTGGADPEKWAETIDDDGEIAKSGRGASALFGGDDDHPPF